MPALSSYQLMKIFSVYGAVGTLFSLLLTLASTHVQALQAITTTGKITLDGKLDEGDWQRAPVSGDFIENMPNEKQPARVKTEVRVLYDKDAIYFGIRAFDPDPSLIHAPFVRRDKVFGTQDNFIVWIDPTGARKFAQFFRVNERGVLADGIWNEDNTDEDFAPDFDFEAVPTRLVDGWSAEFRIPWASLRVPHPVPEKLAFIVFRNMPRETRIRMTNVSLGRDPSCFLCVAEELTGLKDLSKTSGLTVTPYAAVNMSQAREGDAAKVRETKFSAGADIKWRPSSEWIVDGTFRPDFSQLELDTPQLKGNTRFALSVPEKRPFFLEGSDLYSTPYGLIYTRSITDPLWGARATYRSERADATVLTVADRGGGFVLLPGTYYSDARAQGASQSTLARARLPFAALAGTGSFGALISDRNYDDGTTNRAASADAQFKPNNDTRLRAQVVVSETRDVINGVASKRVNGDAMYADANYDSGTEHVWINATSVSPNFRSDNSIVTQNGYRSVQTETWLCRKREGFFHTLCPGIFAKEQHAWDGTPLARYVTPSLYVNGNRNSDWSLQPRWVNYTRVQQGGLWHHVPTLYAKGEGNPGGWLPYAFVEVEGGRGVDVVSDSLARLLFTGVTLNTRPHERAELEWKVSDYRLNDMATQRWRLHERSVQLVGVGYITAQDTLRLIAQHTLSHRNAAMYSFVVTPKFQTQAVSLVYSHKRGLGREFNLGVTQSAERVSGRPDRVTTEVFAKLAWAVNL